LVTGGAGFIARTWRIGWSALGHEVAVLDDLSSGFGSRASRARLYPIDLTDAAGVDACLKEFRPSW